jgi:hypothetical protein
MMRLALESLLLSALSLLVVLETHANVFTLVQTTGPDLETPQPGETFGFEIHYEQLTNLASLGFSLRATGGVRIISAVRSTDCYGPFSPVVCDFTPLSEADGLPDPFFDVSDGLAGPWSYINNAMGSSGAAAGTIDDGTGPPGAVLGSVTVEYLSPGTLEIFENASTDDETLAPPQVITPSFDQVALPSAASSFPLSVVFADSAGDWDPPINVDLVRLELAFDPSTGDYELIWEADPAHPFVGTFRLNANLYNSDTGSSSQDPSFFSDTFNDLTLATPQTIVRLTGNNSRLSSWAAGDRVAPSCPDPLGCPTGVGGFLTAVGPLSGSAEGVDRLPSQSPVIVSNSTPVPALSPSAIMLLILTLVGSGLLSLAARRDRPDRRGCRMADRPRPLPPKA